MLPKYKRLHTRYEYTKTRRRGKLIRNPLFNLYALSLDYVAAGTSLSDSRVGFVLSVGFDKRAVVRNRARRRLSHAVRDNFSLLKGLWWLVFYPEKACLDTDYEKLSTEVAKILQNLSVTGKSGDRNVQVHP